MQILEIIHPRRLACVLAAVMLTVPAIPSAIADEPKVAPSVDVLTVEQLHAELARLKQRVGQLEAKLASNRTDDRMVIGLTKITSKEGAVGENDDWADRYWRNQAQSGN